MPSSPTQPEPVVGSKILMTRSISNYSGGRHAAPGYPGEVVHLPPPESNYYDIHLYGYPSIASDELWGLRRDDFEVVGGAGDSVGSELDDEDPDPGSNFREDLEDVSPGPLPKVFLSFEGLSEEEAGEICGEPLDRFVGLFGWFRRKETIRDGESWSVVVEW